MFMLVRFAKFNLVLIGACAVLSLYFWVKLTIHNNYCVTLSFTCKTDCKANIGRIRRYLTKHAAETLVHVFVTSQIDTNNSLLFGIPKDQLQRLQLLQNIAAHVITYTNHPERSTLAPS